MLRARWVITGVALAGVIAIPALASGDGRRVVGNCTKSQVRPTSIILTCGDANSALTHLHWQRFGGVTAAATGDYSANDCTPNCAAGKFHSYAARIVLSKARVCPDKYDDYRVASLSFASARPPGTKSAQTTISLAGCPLP
ncbi:MAG TPA: hypothetical protein VGG41_19400 [Solirubrobacteraceae bacterium]